jgi:hypothetical protein
MECEGPLARSFFFPSVHQASLKHDGCDEPACRRATGDCGC